MQTFIRGCAAIGLLATGYILGASGILSPHGLHAQDAATPLSDETVDKIRVAHNSLQSARQSLESEGRHQPAIDAVNGFAIQAGGVDALADLESGLGVDPVTFAGLYADRAVQAVADHLSYDEEGRLLYKNKVVRMYSVERLKRMFALQARLAGQEDQPLP